VGRRLAGIVNEPIMRVPLLAGVALLGILPLRLLDGPACDVFSGCSSRK